MIGFCKTKGIAPVDVFDFAPDDSKNRSNWTSQQEDRQTFFSSPQEATVAVEDGPFLIVMQGYCRTEGPATFESLKRFLAEMLRQYRDFGEFRVPKADGNYTIYLIDGTLGKVFLYRNFLGSSLTYYTATANGFFWGDAFSEIAAARGREKTLDEEMLPVLFLGRYPTGAKTLVREIFRLDPGELVVFDGSRVENRRVVTLDDFEESHKTDEAESIERAEAVAAEIMDDWYGLYPNSANLLSGGVDSTFLQVHWNERWRRSNPDAAERDARPLSAVVWLDHQQTQGDLEYTLSAVKQTGTCNIAVRQEPLTPEAMRAIIRRNGEFPNHVQSFYFDTLARGMKEAGITAGISGMGADGLFGNSFPDFLRAAAVWKKRIPFSFLRSWAASFAFRLGGRFTADALRAAGNIGDLEDIAHPLNSALTFTDIPTLLTCFGRNGLEKGMRYRREILKTLRVPDDPQHLQWSLAAGYYWSGGVSAAYWAKLFAESGLVMCSPFLDSRMIRAAHNIRLESHFIPGQSKSVLKKALLRHVPAEFVNRPKRGFGQPIFEWLGPGGPLRTAAEAIRPTVWFSEKTKQNLLAKPNWCLWTMLCYDIWHEMIFEKIN